MSNEIKELASFRAMLLAALTEGMILETDLSDEEVQAKIDWWFKMNDTNNIVTSVAEGKTSALTLMVFNNSDSVVLLSNVENSKMDFFITRETKSDLNEFESEDILNDESYHSQLVDMGSTILFVIRALHDLGIKYSITPAVSDEFGEDEISEDDWGV